MNAKKSSIIYVKIIFLILVGCASSNKKNLAEDKTCNENLAFKKAYFENVQNIENLIDKEQNESFHKSLKFISKYTKVSFESMLNYAHTYPYGVFEKDKVKWLKWYEENMCENIQFKD